MSEIGISTVLQDNLITELTENIKVLTKRRNTLLEEAEKILVQLDQKRHVRDVLTGRVALEAKAKPKNKSEYKKYNATIDINKEVVAILTDSPMPLKAATIAHLAGQRGNLEIPYKGYIPAALPKIRDKYRDICKVDYNGMSLWTLVNFVHDGQFVKRSIM